MRPALEAHVREQIAYEFAREGPPEDFPELPPVPGGRYTDPAFFELERQHLWPKTWLLAGRDEDFPETGSFRCFDLAGPPLVLVRGDDGVLRAFYNTCRHRGAPVVREACGRAARLRCQYHSWTYDLAGRLVALPDRRDFARLDQADRGLVEVRCETLDGWVFVNPDRGAIALREWLGPVADDIACLGGSGLRTLARREKRLACNWKVAADAFLETYHLKTIHAKTVANLLDHRGATMGLLPRGHSRMVTPKWPKNVEAEPAPGTPDIATATPIFRDTNVSYTVFPNLITPLDTIGFPFICFWPIDVRTTHVEWTWYAPADESDSSPFWSALLGAFDRVMEEDFANLAPIQRSLESPALDAIPLGYQERRIYYLHQHIDATIGTERIPAKLTVPPRLAPDTEAP